MGICLWSQYDVKKSWSGVFAPPANALGLSIEEKDLLFCTGIGRWPLPLPSYLCNPANALGLSIEEKDLLFLLLPSPPQRVASHRLSAPSIAVIPATHDWRRRSLTVM